MRKSVENEKKQKKKNSVKFSRAYSRFFVFLCRLVNPLLHAKYIRSKAFVEQKKKGAMLLVSNHLSAYDFVYFSIAMSGAPLNYVVAENMMYSTPIFATLIKSYHAITKKQYFADFQCIKSIKRNLDAGVSVLICPEGKVAADGVTGTIPPSIAKLAKWLGYPIGYLKLQGAGIARPKWASNLRKGKVEVLCDMLYDEEQVKNLSKEEILQGIESAISHNEHKWQIENNVTFKGKSYAEGLHRLLYKCPKCGEEFAMRTSGDHIICDKCKNEVVYTHDGKLVPANENSVCKERIDEWCADQRESVRKEVQNESFAISNEVDLFIENAKSNGYRYIARGVLTLDRNKVVFNASNDKRLCGVTSKFGVNSMDCDFEGNAKTEAVEEEFKHIEFLLKNFDTIAYMPGTSVDFYDENHVYRFMFTKQIASTKYAFAVEEMHRL